MYLTKALLDEIGNPDLSLSDRVHLCCRLAKQLEQAGDFDAAQEAMADVWQGVGARPTLEGLDDETTAHVLLRVGALTGWIGSATQIEGSQEAAKDLISESLRMFDDLGQRNKVGEARSDLALCYWRAGAFDEARVMLQDALSEFNKSDIEQRATALLRRAVVERSASRLNEAVQIYNQAAPLFDEVNDHYITATFHFGFANVLNQLSSVENRKDYVDMALMEYTAASFHFEQVGHERYQACVENNLGFLFSTIGKFAEAHEHLDRAQMLMTRLKDTVHLAQVDETRARVMLAEGRIVDAEKTVRAAVRTLEKGDEGALFAEALRTHGVALVRLGHQAQARVALNRGISAAEQAGDFEGAGLAALTLIEELGAKLSNEDVWVTIHHAAILLEKTQDIAILRRLAKAFLALHEVLAPNDWTNFSLRNAVLGYESHLIKLALKVTGGSVTRAARLLGFKHHQSLITLIASRHKELIETGARTAVRSRRRHLLVHGKRVKKKKVGADHAQAASQISILHVEDNQQIAKLVAEMFAGEEWVVELCADGYGALEKLTGNDHYDLLLVDNDIPGLSGLGLVHRARKITHRRRTPIVMLSGDDCEREAWRAGVDAFLRKPEDIKKVSSTIARLLEEQKDRKD